jgi:cyclase
LSIEARKVGAGVWHCFFESGREDSGISALEWASRASELGAGEILVTSVDMDGTKRGVDAALVEALMKVVDLPVMYSGGVGRVDEIPWLFGGMGVSSVAIGASLHHGTFTISEAKEMLVASSLNPRR